MDELKRLEELKEKAIANPSKKAKGCKSCKKKKDTVTQLPTATDDLFERMFIPSIQDINLAYVELGSKNIDKDKKDFIGKVYEFLFNEEFDWDCKICISTQSRKFYNYCKDKNII